MKYFALIGLFIFSFTTFSAVVTVEPGSTTTVNAKETTTFHCSGSKISDGSAGCHCIVGNNEIDSRINCEKGYGYLVIYKGAPIKSSSCYSVDVAGRGCIQAMKDSDDCNE